MVAFGFVVYLFILTPLGVVWSGFVLSKLWVWFVVPSFGIAAISIPAAIGLALILHYTIGQDAKREDSKADFGEAMLRGAVLMAGRPAVVLAIGWVVSQWM